MFWCARNLVRSGAASKQLVQQQCSSLFATGSIRSYTSNTNDNKDGDQSGDNNNNDQSKDTKKPQQPQQAGGSTVDIKKLLAQFDQKFQMGLNTNKSTAAASSDNAVSSDSNTGDNQQLQQQQQHHQQQQHQTNFNLDEVDDDAAEEEEDPDITEGRLLLDRVVEEEYEVTPYLFDAKMIKEYNRYQEKAVPADYIDRQEDIELIEMLAENEPIDKEILQQLREEAEEKMVGASYEDVEDNSLDYDSPEALAEARKQQLQQMADEDDMMDNQDNYLEADDDGEEGEQDEPTDNTDLFDWMDSVKFDERNKEHTKELQQRMGEERLAELADLREYMKQVGHNYSDYTVRDMLEIMELDEEDLVELVEDDLARYDVEQLDLDDNVTLDQIPKYELDEDGEEIEGKISEAYIKYARDYYEIGADTPLDAAEAKAIADGENERADATNQTQPGEANTLYDEENVGENFFLGEDTPYDEKDVAEISEALNKEPIFEYEIDNAQEQLMDQGLLDDMQTEFKSELEFENHVYDLVAKKLGISELPKGVTLESMGKMNKEQFASLLRQINFEQFVNLSAEESDRVLNKVMDEVYNDLKVEYEKKNLSQPKQSSPKSRADEIDEDDDEVLLVEDEDEETLDTTANFEIDEKERETNIFNSRGLVELNDLAEEIVMADEVNGNSWKDDLQVLGLEADMYLRRNQKKMKVLAKRRERAAKYREATLAKNRENPAPPKPYQRQALPEGDNVYTTPMAPNTFIRIKELTEDEGAEHKQLYGKIFAESNRTLSANGYYTHQTTKQSMTQLRQILASYKPHLKSRRQQLEDSTITKDPRFEKNKSIIVEPWQLPRHNPEYYSYDDRK
ncbi:hypothetical protein PPL_10363 [Heterostelium album PN500]|uniref:Uncharacterized protein n=1 Tax=Heterostelium pallidum (strain ATCC 26659 / Pp 5 / PN500) TaxID=670386 RepID=D3BQ43_HETP5|nr:hypothetical protein PPL_10363 [Heterostelium album PN500]EFA76594.1 hypothetical protein PPL_10363 [Heterostelium album PN500]|eukprot:XP_020428726.1 hypothetical protein PPL_10363 [Heterostelium album PN500]